MPAWKRGDGSTAFVRSLPARNVRNNVSTVRKNVVDAFIKPGMLPGSLWIAEEKQWK